MSAGELSVVVPDAPVPVFGRACGEERAAAIEAVRAMVTNPRIRPPVGSSRYFDPAVLKVSESLRGRLIRAQEHGYVIPDVGGVNRSDLTRRSSWKELEYVYPAETPADKRITDPVRQELLKRVLRVPATLLAVALVVGLFGIESANWVVWEGIAAFVAAIGFLMAGVRLAVRRDELRDRITYAERSELRQALLSSMNISQTPAGDREAALAAIADGLIGRITSSVAWESGYLDIAHAVFDPAAERREIHRFASKIRETRLRLGPVPLGNSPEATQAREHRERQVVDLDLVFDTLVERVGALQHYSMVMASLSDKIEALRSIERSLTVGHDITDLAQQLGANELAIDRYDRLIADATGLRVAITTLATELSTTT